MTQQMADWKGTNHHFAGEVAGEANQLRDMTLIGTLREFWLHLRHRWLAILAFTIPAGVRAIPEVLAGPYPIGWDTLAFYVPVTMDWAAGTAGFLAMIGEAPLIYMISVPASKFFQTDPVVLFKVMGPVLYGFVIFSLFEFLRAGLRWNQRKSFATAIFTALYFVTLRVGWDLYRNMLGLGFILLGLPLLIRPEGSRNKALLSALIVLSVLSNQFTAILFLFLVSAKAAVHLTKNERELFFDLSKVATPGLLTFISIVVAEAVSSGNPFPKQPPLPETQSFWLNLQFMGYAYLPIIFLAILGVRKVRNLEMGLWSVLCFVASVLSSVPFLGVVETSYRWTLLLTIPLCVYAADGLSRVKRIGAKTSGLFGLLLRNVPRVVPVALLLFAMLYVALPDQQASAYYTLYPGLLPTSMLQNTIPQSDFGSLTRILGWLEANSNLQTALITHQAFYGWAREYFHGPATIINYGYHDPTAGVQLAEQRGYSTIVTIWWINGHGWHGQPNPPEGFVPIHVDGYLAALEYEV